MTLTKRLTDIALAVLLTGLLALPFGFLLLWLRLTEGAPVFYVAERMRAPGRPFHLWKLRTMTTAPGDFGVSGGDKTGRITPTGRFLRQTRLDEVPQLWNVLKGDMSFVGPRPPLRTYVERFPALYAQVLRSRPGVTGLATLIGEIFSKRNSKGLSKIKYRCNICFDRLYRSPGRFCRNLGYGYLSA